MQYLGDFAEDATIFIPFNTFSSDDPQASVTITNLADADIHIHKDGDTDEISTDGATIEINYDGITGNHLITIVSSVDAAYSTGSDYLVRIEGTTVDGGTINAFIASFSIENRFNEVAVVAWNGVALGTTNPLPNADADGAGGLVISDAGAQDFDAMNTAAIRLTAARAQVLTDWINGGRLDLLLDAIKVPTDKMVFTVANQLDSNILSISGDGPAADNLEATFDGSGYDNDEAPAKQSQVTNLTVAGSASKVPALLSPNGFVIAFGENEANTEDATRPLDGTTHDIEAQNDGGTERIDVYYETNVGAGSPSEVTWHGRLDRGGGAAKNIDVLVQDVDAATWRTIGNIESSTSLATHTFDIFINEVGTSSDLGTVRIRFLTGSVSFSATTKLLTDQIFVSFNAGTASSLDSVYFDSNASNTGTSSSDGLPGNPVSTEAAVNTLLTARNLSRVVVAVGSSITFATGHTGEEWTGEIWTLGLGAQNLASSLFVGADVSGAHTGAARFVDCDLGTMSTAGMTTKECGHSGTITITAAGTYVLDNSYSKVAGGSTPIIDTGAAVGNVNLSMPDYHNGIELRNINATGTDNFSISGIGQIIYAATCSGTVHQRGDWKVTNTGGVTITADDNTTKIAATLVDTADMQPKIGTPAADLSADIAAVKVDTATVLVDTGTTLPALIESPSIKKNATYSNFPFLMVLASDGKTPATGLTVTGQRRLDNGSFGAVSGTIAEVSNGIYEFDALAADTNGDTGVWRFSAATADDTFVTFKTI